MSPAPLHDAAFVAVTITRLFAPLRRELGMDENPLATGFYCPECNTRLDRADRPCPLGCQPSRTFRLREHQSRAVRKVGAGSAFPGAVVLMAVAANA